MKSFNIKPIIVEYNNFMDFANEENICDKDLILTNKYILDKEKMGLNCHVVYQEEYGVGEPSDVMINDILNIISAIDFDRVIAVGGGTVIDIAKVLVVAGKVLDVNELYESATELTKYHELIIIPTTCGTGSEVTNISVVNRTVINTKQGLVSEAMFADKAVLVGEFIESLPYKVFATSSLDALIHAVESFLSPKATEFSKLFSAEAIRMIIEGYMHTTNNEGSIVGYGNHFLRAANYAGIAFQNAGCGTVHAMSYAFGGKYHVPHGEANYELFMAVLKYYSVIKPSGEFEKLIDLLSEYFNDGNKLDGFNELLDKVLLRKPLREYGVSDEEVKEFAKSTIDNQQRLLANSYVAMSVESIEAIYTSCLYK